MPDAFRAGETETGDASSLLQRFARGRVSGGEERRGRSEAIGGQPGLRCGNFSAAAACGHRDVRVRYGTTRRDHVRRIGFAAEHSRARASCALKL